MSSSHQQRASATTRTSPLVESMISGDRDGVGGILANDVNGLCLFEKGNMVTRGTSTTSLARNGSVNDASCDNSGVYTSLTRLASTLAPCRIAKASSSSSTLSSTPLITIEMEGPTSILIKEYDGHTVAMRVPNVTKLNNDDGV
jgi:hypothetical protein